MGRISALTELTSLASNDYIIVLDSSANIAKKITVANAFGIPDVGWTATGETWTFSSYSSTTKLGVITVPTNATTKYTRGMWVRIVQTTGGTKYGMTTAVTATTLTINFFSHTLNNETISTPFYSPLARPYGVPTLPYAWTEANGWNVWDYGVERLIWYRATVAVASVPAGSFGNRGASVNTPSGYTSSQMGAGRSSTSDQAISASFNYVSYPSSIGWDVQNNYTGGAVNPSFNWYQEVRVQV